MKRTKLFIWVLLVSMVVAASKIVAGPGPPPPSGPATPSTNSVTSVSITIN